MTRGKTELLAFCKCVVSTDGSKVWISWRVIAQLSQMFQKSSDGWISA